MQSESRITQQELASLFPDGVPMPVMKMIFPEKSEKLTVEDIRYILNAMRSEAALSTDAEPVSMDDEDRTPIPAGFDGAMWRKADEVHHAMALVARDQECVKIIYATLSTHNAEPVKTAPDVAVKALEWRDEPVPPSGETLAPSVAGLYCIPHSGDRFYLRFRDAITLGDYSTLDKAKAAAQADYETRIRSALSAQVQDVAGLELRPHEPTEEMLAAAVKADQDGMPASMKTIWMVMWAAYSVSPSAKNGEEK